MNTQEILNLVIDGGFYTDSEETRCKSVFMCIAIKYAMIAGVVTEADYDTARNSIEEWLCNVGNLSVDVVLEDALEDVGIPNTYEERLKIYRDWDNRPLFKIGDFYRGNNGRRKRLLV